MKHKKQILSIGFAAVLTCAAIQSNAQNLVYGSYIVDTELEAGGGSVDGDGFNVGISADIAEQIYVFADYDAAEYDGNGSDLEINTISAGVGARTAIGAKAKAYAAVSFDNLELEVGSASDDESGFGLRAGISGAVAPKVWLNGEVYYQNIDELDGLFFIGRAGYDLTRELGLYAEYRTGEYDGDDGDALDRDDVRVGAYFRF